MYGLWATIETRIYMSRSKRIALWWFTITGVCSILILIGAGYVKNIRTRNTKDLSSIVMSGWERETTGKRNSVGQYVIKYKNQLGDIAKGGESLMFFAYHGDVSVYSENVLMYSMYMDKSSCYFPTVSGDAWNCVFIPEDMANKNIEVSIHTNYASYLDYEPTFYLGDRMTIIKNELFDGLLNLVLVIIMFSIGIVIIGYSLVTSKNKSNNYDFIYLGIFAVMLSVWFFINMPLVNMVTDIGTILTYLSYIILGAITVPLVLFEKRLMDIKYSNACDKLCIMSIIVQVCVFSLQLFGILDMKETLIMTHISIGVSILGLVGLLVLNFITIGWKNLYGICKLNMLCGLLTALGVGFDIVYYYLDANGGKNYIFTKITFLIHVISLSYYSMSETRKLMIKGRDAKKLETLAFRDELTGVLNRTACNNDMKQMNIMECKYTVIMFDLNNLKKCNDTLGHNFGDNYIKSCSTYIKESFASVGNCYRIGGDEFCVIGKNIREEDIEACYCLMQSRIDEYNIRNPKVNMSVAYGYAEYDMEQDEDLKDTRGRADKIMYKNKMNMKANRL